jgi:hypothetical protein
MPTPDSGSTSGNGGKRRRTDNYTMAHSQIREDAHRKNDEEEQEQEEDEDEEVETPSQLPSQPLPEPDEEGDLKFYNPNQDPEARRRLRANMREHQRMLDGEFSTLVHGR